MFKIITRKEFRLQVLNISLILAVVTIPLQNNLNSWAIVFFCVSCVIANIPTRIKLPKPWLFLTGLGLFLWMALTFFWDTSGGFSIKNLEGYAGFVFLPFVLSIAPPFSEKTIRHACLAFLVSVTVVGIACLVLSWVEYRETGDSRVFYYHYLSQQMGLNAIFLSNYCIAGMSWLLYFWFVRTPAPSKSGAGWIITWCIFLFSFVFLLSSKLVIFLMLLMLTFFLLYIGKKRKQLRGALIILSLVIIAATVAVNKFYYLRWRLSVTEFKNYEGATDDQNGFAARLLMWRSTVELVRDRPIAGYGVRGANEILFKKYEEKNFVLGIENRYNSHNQYLQIALMSGLIGLGFFIAFLAIAWGRAIKSKSILLTLILLHFITISLVESTFEVQQELIFFLFFIFLFYYHLAPRLSYEK
jgi:O-antigen ligase